MVHKNHLNPKRLNRPVHASYDMPIVNIQTTLKQILCEHTCLYLCRIFSLTRIHLFSLTTHGTSILMTQ